MNIALMLPCPVAIYDKDGRTFISTMLPSALLEFYPDAGIDNIASDVEKVALQIVNEAK